MVENFKSNLFLLLHLQSHQHFLCWSHIAEVTIVIFRAVRKPVNERRRKEQVWMLPKSLSIITLSILFLSGSHSFTTALLWQRFCQIKGFWHLYSENPIKSLSSSSLMSEIHFWHSGHNGGHRHFMQQKEKWAVIRLKYRWEQKHLMTSSMFYIRGSLLTLLHHNGSKR